MNIQHINHRVKGFPESLLSIPSTPKELFVAGEIPDLPCVAIVGTRRPTQYGRHITYKIAYDLAKAGLCIVSGLALGIDGVAHQAALDAGGKTIAVLACGLDRPYPAANTHIFRKIVEGGGAVLSEYSVGTPGLKQNFVARNRIIAGLALATVVTEADAKSGSLITANFALIQNRTVMAVPGNTTSPRSAGPNNLIRLGARLVTSAIDVLAELELQSTELKTTPVTADSREEALILQLITEGITQTDELIEQSELPAPQMASILSLMEITGKVRNMGAGQWIVR